MTFSKTHFSAAIIIAAGFFCTCGCSDIDNTPSDTIISSIADRSAPSETDIYADNISLLESSIETEIDKTETETESEIFIDPDSPVLQSHLKFQGRHVYKDDIQWLVQSGSSAEFTVTGTSAYIVITNIDSINRYRNQRPRYAVFIDGELIRDKVISAPEEKLILFEENSMHTATVKIMLLSEAYYGAVGIKDIDVIGSDPNPVKPVLDNDIAIEFIGDSITCGYGVDTNTGDEDFSTEIENFLNSYAYIAAEELNADYSVVAYSGCSVLQGCNSDEPDGNENVFEYYDIASTYSGYDKKWDFSEKNIDAVVINLGSNDTEYVYDDNNKEVQNEFIKKYVSILKKVRTAHPDAAIICTTGLMGDGEKVYSLIERAVKKFGDDKITCFLSPEMNIEKDGVGAAWHPSKKTHKKYGHIIAEEIKKALGK